jgi:hypothetical protein
MFDQLAKLLGQSARLGIARRYAHVSVEILKGIDPRTRDVVYSKAKGITFNAGRNIERRAARNSSEARGLMISARRERQRAW